ncbi:MAG: helix-turn-helix domain-containing protein [Patescibacteria group bacterium]|nr:helix-turn-helix domain-containing protein [Patescibacteria group bacterium]
MNDPEVLTTKEAAALLRLTEDTVRRQAAAGQIPALAMGRHWRFYRADLHKYLRGEWQSSNANPMAPGGSGSGLAARIFSEVRARRTEQRRRSSSRPFGLVTGGKSS